MSNSRSSSASSTKIKQTACLPICFFKKKTKNPRDQVINLPAKDPVSLSSSARRVDTSDDVNSADRVLEGTTTLTTDSTTSNIPRPCTPTPNFENVSLRAIIGQGAYGIVYKAEWDSKIIAVKETWIKKDDESDARRDSLSEVKNERGLMREFTVFCAPNIVKYYGYSFNQTNYMHRIYMEYMPNRSLQTLILTTKNSFLNLEQKYTIIRDTIRGLRFMHILGVIHRDLKTNNILLDENYRAKICDFGLSGRLGQVTGQVGTYPYLAPEIFACEEPTLAADIYSFAICMWEIMAWKAPFQDESNATIVKDVNRGARPPLPQKCPPKIEHLIRWGWHAEKNARPTASVIDEELISPITECSEKLKKAPIHLSP